MHSILRFLKAPVLVCLVLAWATSQPAASSGGVLLQGFYTIADPAHPGSVPAPVPSSVDGTGSDPWWDHLAKQAEDLRGAGFTAVWLPSVLKGASGKSSTGYDPFDDYDIGSKDQKGTVATHFGTREELERCVAIFRANGIDVYLDLVDNHRNGDPGGAQAFQFRYVGAFGNPGGGRFEKNPGDFHHRAPPPPNIDQDPDVFEGPGEKGFGPDLSPINGQPKDHVFNGLVDAGDWLTRALDVQGYRLDDVKGISTRFMFPFLNRKSMKGKFAVGEFFDGADAIEGWISGGMRGRASGFDYPLHFVLRDMCQSHGFFNMSQLDHAGLAGRDPLRAVTFVENHDTDTNPAFAIIDKKALAYAYVLTSEGYPCVFYKDYSTDKGCFGLKPVIDNLVWVHERLAAGDTLQRFKDPNVFAFERLGGHHLLVGLSDNEAVARQITVDTGFGARVNLHDYSGHGPDTRTDDFGRASLTIPRNDAGLGYVCYSVAGIDEPTPPESNSVTQDYEGAPDLDIPPADNTRPVQVCRVWSAAGKTVKAGLRFDNTAWTAQSRIDLDLSDPAGAVVGKKSYLTDTAEGDGFAVKAKAEGFYTFKIRSFDTPPANQKPPYTLSVTYTAPRKLR